MGGRGASSCRFDRRFGHKKFFRGQCNKGVPVNYLTVDFTIDSSNPDETTHPHVLRTISVFRELQLARQNRFHVCVPLVNTVTWMSIMSTDSTY